MNKNDKTIILVGGGTGGHIVPILNVYNELKKTSPALNVVVVGGNTPVDQKLYSEVKDCVALKTGKLHRALSLENLIQFFYFLWGLYFSLIILIKTKPDLIFSKAGYVSFPIILWSKILKIPYFIHESDIEMGVANKFAASAARRVFVGFPKKYYPGVSVNKLVFVGQVLKPDYAEAQGESFDFGFKTKKPVIFVTGGSQGSRNINNAVFKSLGNLLERYNVIHHTGNLDYRQAIELRSKLSDNLKQFYFISPLLTKTRGGIDMMKSAIHQSELVISRASATTLSEVSSLKKPIIAVPYKYAASDHQNKNAKFYRDHKAAIIISDDELNAKVLVKEIDYLFEHKDKMKELGDKAYDLLPRNGTEQVVDQIELFLNKGYHTPG